MMIPPCDLQLPNPISILRPHYIVLAEAGVGPTAPPQSAISPSQIQHAYGFDSGSNQGAGQVIGIADADDDPNIESDLANFDQQFSLPACTSGNGCFHKVYECEYAPVPNTNWGMEVGLDVEWARADRGLDGSPVELLSSRLRKRAGIAFPQEGADATLPDGFMEEKSELPHALGARRDSV